MKTVLCVFFISFVVICNSQTRPTVISKPISSDCTKAISIVLKDNATYGVTLPPRGFGDEQEFRTTDSHTFEGEHNSAWYLLSVTKDGELVFDITPQDTTNDYDFLLYSYTDSSFCNELQKNKLKPIRSNLSNIKKSQKGVTGLKPNTKKNTIGEGIGTSYSKSIGVKKDEKYMLILDNVTPEGKGHTIHFYYLKNVEIKGSVINSDSVPMVADITLSDNRGNTVEETKSDTKGNYVIKTAIIENQNYNLSIVSDSTFVQTAMINTKTLKGTSEFDDIRVVLPKLKKGEKYKLGNINFYGNAAIILPESFSSVEALYKLMQKNEKMVIQIQGHVNDTGERKNSRHTADSDQKLSDARAASIYQFLLKKGIAKKRMSCIGLSNNFPLFKNPQNEEEESANRRVEIKVVSLE